MSGLCARVAVVQIRPGGKDHRLECRPLIVDVASHGIQNAHTVLRTFCTHSGHSTNSRPIPAPEKRILNNACHPEVLWRIFVIRRFTLLACTTLLIEAVYLR